MMSLPESLRLKKLVKNTARGAGITPTTSLNTENPLYIAVYQNRYELHCHGRIVVDDDVCKVI